MNIRIVLSLTVASLALAACGGTGPIVTTPEHSPSATQTEKEPAEKSPAPAKVGDSLKLDGPGTDVLTVTVVRVVPSVKAADGYTSPAAGNRFAAVQYRIVNSGTATYDGLPSGGTAVIDAADQQFTEAIILGDSTAGPSLPSEVKLAPGGKVLGYVTYEVPKAARLVTVQFSLDFGVGSTGQWKIS